MMMLPFTRSGRAVTLNTALDMFRRAQSSAGHGYCDLSNLCMQPPFMEALVAHLPEEQSGSWEGSVTLDLSENRLGSLDEAQLRALAKALKARPWLRVRLGFEVMAPRVLAALEVEGMGACFGSQVCVDRPWENPTNRRLGEAIAKMDELLGKVVGDGRQYEGHIRTQSAALEHEMAAAVASMLEKGAVITASYRWAHTQQGRPGDVDGIVIGEYRGQEVVVICEAKTNVQADVGNAVRQVRANAERWGDLCEASCGGDSSDDAITQADREAGAKDLAALRVAELRGRRVMLAIGGQVFPSDLDGGITKRLGAEWISVRMDGMTAEVHAHGKAMTP